MIEAQMRKSLTAAICLALALCASAATAAEDRPALKEGAAATASRTVTLTYLKAAPGRLAHLERYVRANWFAMDAAAVSQGLFVSYKWLDTGREDGPWNAVVIVTYNDDKGFAGIEERWGPIRSAHKEVRPDGLAFPDVGRVIESQDLLERAPFADAPPA
jgi:hypothetical protein